MRWLSNSIPMFVLLSLPWLSACDGPALAPNPMTACRFPAEQGIPATVENRPDIQIVFHEGDGLGGRLAADAATAFTAMSGVKFAPHAVTDVTDATMVLCQAAPDCPRHAIAVGHLAVLFESHRPKGQTVRTRMQMVDDRRIWWLQGDGVLGQQYAVYRFLQRLGVRYYHPRATYYPLRQGLSIDRSVEATEAPGIKRRGWHLNTAIPAEAHRPFIEPGAQNLAHAKQIIDWLVANGQNFVGWTLLETDDLDFAHTHTRQIVAHARLRGLTVGLAVSLLPNSSRIYSLSGPHGVSGDMEERLQALADDGVQEIQAVSQPSPLRYFDERAALDVIHEFHSNLAAVSPPLRGALLIPSTPFSVANGDESPMQRVARAAHPSLGLDLAADSFFSLFQDHEHQLRLLEGELGARAISYSPRTSSWNGRDTDVPLFLPASWYTRWHDANRLLAYPELHRHLTVDAGWEWGTWVNGAMVFAATWDPQLNFAELVDQVLGPIGRNTCNRLSETLTAMATDQSEQFTAGRLAPYLTGQSSAAVVFNAVGNPLQPLRLPYAELVTLTPAAAVTFETEILFPLIAHLERWTAMESRLLPVIPRVDEAARPFVQEIIDGVGVTRLRLVHGVALLKSVQAIQGGELAAAAAFIEEARDQTNIASLMIAARESQYRYPVEDLAGVSSNATAYPFGYLHAARTLRYWTEEEQEADRAISLPK